MRNNQVAKVLAIVLVAAFLFAVPFSMKAQATEETYDVALYKGDKAQEDWTYPTKEGMVFAGWFADESYTEAYAGTTGQAYAKFVDAQMMTVKKQFLADATVTSPKMNVRFLTGIESLKLASVTFHVKLDSLNKTWNMTETTAYSAIMVDGVVNPATPSSVFGASAKYFVLHSLVDIPNSVFADDFEAYVSWKTLDGTTVTNSEATATFTVKDELLERGQYTAMTNNILAVGLYENTVPAERYAKLYASVQKYAPDVLALQECDWSWHAYMLDDNQFNEAANHGLQPLSGLGYAAAADQWGMTGSMYITDNNTPLYYKEDTLDLLECGFETYSSQRDGESRGFTWAVFAKEGSDKPLFAASSTHIAISDSPEVAGAQIQQLVAFMKNMESQKNIPLVMMGDYNTDPGDAHYSAFELGTKLLNTKDAAASVSGLEYQTHNLIGRIPDGVDASKAGVIDHVLISTKGIVANSHKVLVEKINASDYTYTYSDHVPVLAKFQFIGNSHVHSYGAASADDHLTHVRYCNCGAAEHTEHTWALDNGNVVCDVCGTVNAQNIAKYHCVCGAAEGGEHTCKTPEYRLYLPWTSTTSLPNSGSYYLVNDVVTQYQRHFTDTVYLDLNGKTITAEENRRVLVPDGGTLNLCDSVGTGRVYSTGTSGQGLVAWIKGNSTLNLYSGVLDGSAVNTTAYGATVAMESGATFNMYGGTVNGGTTTGDGSAVGGYGGTNFNLYGGIVNGGSANVGGAVFTSGSFTMEGGTINGGTANYGGSLYLGGSTTYTISGGTITGGTANNNGGNIFTAQGESVLEIKGNAIVSYGKATGDGGNICNWGPLTIDGSAQLLNDAEHKTTGGGGNIYGGDTVTVKGDAVISGGNAQGAGGNIHMKYGIYVNIQDNAQITDGYTDDTGGNIRGHVNMSGGKVLRGNAKANGDTYNMHIHSRDLNMSGGEIDGGVWVSEGTTVTLSGKATIKGGWTNLSINNGIKINIVEGFNGEIWVDMPSNGTGVFSVDNMSAHAQYFRSTDGYTVAFTDSGALQLVEGKFHCICGAGVGGTHTCKTPEYHEYLKWEGDTSLPTSGYYYLTKTVTFAGQNNITGDLYIDLNGQTITRTVGGSGQTRVLDPKQVSGSAGKLTICDSGSKEKWGGVCAPTGSNGQQGACIWLHDGGTLNLYSGIIDGRNITTTNYGATIALESGTTFNMYGGIVYGGTTTGDGSAVGAQGGSTVNLYGGDIYGLSANVGGAVFTSGSFAMEGGTINGGTANYGGSLYLGGATTYTISGGLIDGGSAANGGNIFGAAGSVVIVINGDTVVSNGTATGNGTASSGTGRGGNICSWGPLTVEGSAQIKFGQAVRNGDGGDGGNIYAGNQLTVGGNAQLINDANHKVYRGANIYGASTGVLLKDNAVVEGGHSTKQGGNVDMAYDIVLSIQDNAEIRNGHSDDSGGNVRGSINMSGGKIYGGSATANGYSANILVRDRSFTMSGGTIEGKIWVYNSKVTLSGTATITGAARNLSLVNGNKVTVESDFSGLVGISLQNDGNATQIVGVFTKDGAADYIGCFDSDNDAFVVSVTDTGALQLVAAE